MLIVFLNIFPNAPIPKTLLRVKDMVKFENFKVLFLGSKQVDLGVVK